MPAESNFISQSQYPLVYRYTGSNFCLHFALDQLFPTCVKHCATSEWRSSIQTLKASKCNVSVGSCNPKVEKHVPSSPYTLMLRPLCQSSEVPHQAVVQKMSAGWLVSCSGAHLCNAIASSSCFKLKPHCFEAEPHRRGRPQLFLLLNAQKILTTWTVVQSFFLRTNLALCLCFFLLVLHSCVSVDFFPLTSPPGASLFPWSFCACGTTPRAFFSWHFYYFKAFYFSVDSSRDCQK